MKVRLIKTIESNDSVDSKFDYKHFIVTDKNRRGRLITREIFENQGEYLTLRTRKTFPTLEEAFKFLT